MSDVIKLAPSPAGDDGFGEIFSGLAEEIDSLRCVEAVMRANCTRLGTDLDAAMGLLIRTVKRIDELHTELDEWDVGRRKRLPEPPGA